MLYPPKHVIAIANGVVIGYIASRISTNDADGNGITTPIGDIDDVLNKFQVPRELQVFEQ